MSGGPECQGITAAGRLMLEHDPEPEHATQVCRIALELFDGALRLHGLASEHRRLLTAAALLHDTGYSVDPMRHHKGSRDIILASILPGFAKQEQAIIACVARYHRKAHPKESHQGVLRPAPRPAGGRTAAGGDSPCGGRAGPLALCERMRGARQNDEDLKSACTLDNVSPKRNGYQRGHEEAPVIRGGLWPASRYRPGGPGGRG